MGETVEGSGVGSGEGMGCSHAHRAWLTAAVAVTLLWWQLLGAEQNTAWIENGGTALQHKSLSCTLDGAAAKWSVEGGVKATPSTLAFQELEGPCRNEAVERVKRIRLLLEKDAGPVLVGGIGDSGTRGVQILLSHLGVDMGYKNHPGIKDTVFFTYDSLVFMNGAPAVPCDRKDLSRVGPHDVYDPILKDLHRISFTREELQDDELWYLGEQLVANITWQMYWQVREDARVDKSLHPSLLFGFKHPRTALLLPFYKPVLGDKFKFIHVLRDGRDVANGSNRQMFQGLCSDYFGRKCKNTLTQRLEFWAAMNLEVHNWGREHLGAGQYLMLRIEDLIEGRAGCVRAVSDLLDLDEVWYSSRVTAKRQGRRL
ncbi:Uncharacterized protein SCF082_LOCUS23939 [Durusdinium trenchii]|uniref:Protein-tyrosine sulfotransferase n=1 Tax=Durusdinium trenchii TaxID=1381693 RepID=A0ABP0LRS6_9DINO